MTPYILQKENAVSKYEALCLLRSGAEASISLHGALTGLPVLGLSFSS